MKLLHIVQSQIKKSETKKIEIKFGQENKNEIVMSLLLQPRSLLVVKDSLYNEHLHSVPFRDYDVISHHTANRGVRFWRENLAGEMTIVDRGGGRGDEAWAYRTTVTYVQKSRKGEEVSWKILENIPAKNIEL